MARVQQMRALVRVIVTYAAAAFVFVGGGVLIVCLSVGDKTDEALDLFHVILPVAAAIISYWFAGRNAEKQQNNTPSNDIDLKSDNLKSV